MFEEVESELTNLEDLQEELDLQEKTLDMRLNIALTREKHNHKINELKGNLLIKVNLNFYVSLISDELTQSHKAKMIILEKSKEDERKEKQKYYDSKFIQDVKEFKEKGCSKGIVQNISIQCDIDFAPLK